MITTISIVNIITTIVIVNMMTTIITVNMITTINIVNMMTTIITVNMITTIIIVNMNSRNELCYCIEQVQGLVSPKCAGLFMTYSACAALNLTA